MPITREYCQAAILAEIKRLGLEREIEVVVVTRVQDEALEAMMQDHDSGRVIAVAWLKGEFDAVPCPSDKITTDIREAIDRLRPRTG